MSTRIEIIQSSSPTRSTATLMKTGQTTSFRTGDDGDIEAGRDTDFLTLDTAPLHNDGTATLNTTTNRFTDTLGDQTYTDDIVLDWSTWNGSTLLAYTRELGLTNNTTWDLAIDFCNAYTLGGFSGWRMWNYKEFINIVDVSATAHFGFTPFNNATAFQYWLSTSNGATVAFIASASYRIITSALKTGNSGRAYPVRTFSLSTLNILS